MNLLKKIEFALYHCRYYRTCTLYMHEGYECNFGQGTRCGHRRDLEEGQK